MSSEMSSFYGGRRGFSFVLRQTFDGFDIPQPDTDPTVTDYTYGKAYYAVTVNNKFIITEDAEVGNVEIAEGKYLIKRNSYNYKDYMWEFHDNDGSKIDDTDYDFPIVIAQGLKQCFDKGINSLNEVGYSEYVIIDSVVNMCNWDDPDNGKIFQRGGDPENLYNIKYICQLTGPKGEQIIIDMDHYSIIEAVDPHLEMIYSEANEDLVPGSYVENNVKKFNDTINFAYTYVRNSLGDIEKCLIGFKIPTLVEEYTAKSIKPYENRATDPETGEYYNYDLISEDPEYYIDNKWVHPFYQKWNIKIPHGYHGVNSDGFELVPSKTKPEKFGNDSYPGTAVYLDQELSQPFVYEGEPLILKTSYETLRGDSFIKGQNWMNILFNNQKLYVSINDCYRNILRYKETNFDNIEAGEITYYELDFFEPGHIIVNQNGNELPQRKNLEFIGQQVEVTDDPLNDKTMVNVLRQSGGYFGTVTGQGAEGVKQVVVSEDQDFKLQNGTLLLVRFDGDNTHTPTDEEISISLNVNNTGANLIVQTEDYENYTNIAYGRTHYVNLYMYCTVEELGETFPIWFYIGSNIGQRRAEEGEKDFSLITTGDKYRWDIKLDDNPSFEPASTRTNIISKESISTLFGKIQKWFADLKTVAFTNDYNDLDNKPDILQSDWEQSDSTAIDYIKNKPETLGHIVVDNGGDQKPNQPYLQFSGYTKVINDSLNKKTIISDAPIDIEWDDYIELSDAEKANNHYLIHNAPGGGGGGITVSQVVTQGDTNAVSGNAVYNYVDTMITQALTGLY